MKKSIKIKLFLKIAWSESAMIVKRLVYRKNPKISDARKIAVIT